MCVCVCERERVRHPVEQRVSLLTFLFAISLFTGYSNENAQAQRFRGENIPPLETTPSAKFCSVRMFRHSGSESGFGTTMPIHFPEE